MLLHRVASPQKNRIREISDAKLNHPTTKGKVYSEEEDPYLLCRLNYYGMTGDDVYQRIKKDITEFPIFRFD